MQSLILVGPEESTPDLIQAPFPQAAAVATATGLPYVGGSTSTSSSRAGNLLLRW